MSAADAPRFNILIADDHPLIRAGIRTCLGARPHWHICAEAANGEATVHLAQEYRPHLVILDFALPLRNGLEVTRDLCRQFPEMAVLIYTMHTEDQLVFDLLEAGARGYVSKNDDDITLILAVDALAAGGTYTTHAAGRRSLTASPFGQETTSISALTPRELEVVRLVAEGETNKRIAALLNISIKTVDTHRTAAMRKLGVHTAVELARYAVRMNLIRL
ncbi:response regulator transcription factor [Rhizobium rhizogenes]|uniref:response regulator n=1 Tax=Rhizobium rhizogenes TaxID=359 RepID=UPI00069130E2|nr:response regulator transcription factor [Rhizobium rhizogenes]